ncbi:hypothetical protein [Trichothermofontia sp.]
MRQAERSVSLAKALSDRAEKEVADITAILRELQQSIERELASAEPQAVQLSLFSDPEREQWERNRRSLADRLMQIPAEIEQETALIRRRFPRPRPDYFPWRSPTLSRKSSFKVDNQSYNALRYARRNHSQS